MAATVDHVSGGRFVLGLGAGNRELEATAHGLEPGRSVGERLDWLDESLGVIRGLLDGGTVDYVSDRYRFDGAHHAPQPMQARVPFVVGSAGEKKGLRIVARHADIWQMWLAMDDVALFQHKRTVLQTHCRTIGRDPATIEPMIGGKLVIRATPEAARSAFEEQVRVHGWTDPIQTETAWTGTSREVARRCSHSAPPAPRASARRSRRRSTSRPWSGWRARSAPSSTRGSPGGEPRTRWSRPTSGCPRHGAGHGSSPPVAGPIVWWLAVAATWTPPPRWSCRRP